MVGIFLMLDCPSQLFSQPQVITDHKLIKSKHTIKRINQYAPLETIGQTANGNVYLAVDVETSPPYADGQGVSIGNVTQGGPVLEREIRLLCAIRDPNVMILHEVLHAKHQRMVYLMLEWAWAGSLSQVLQRHLSEMIIAPIFKQIYHAVGFLYSRGIVHHDLKPSNILVCNDGVTELSDCRIGHSIDSTDTAIGTQAYRAPALFDESEDNDLDPVKEVVWSLGVSM
jgi:serine/threonine protein kinase